MPNTELWRVGSYGAGYRNGENDRKKDLLTVAICDQVLKRPMQPHDLNSPVTPQTAYLRGYRDGYNGVPEMPEFAGYVVTYWDHETRSWETRSFPTMADVLLRCGDPKPTMKEFLLGYTGVGNHVMKVTTLDGKMLYDNTAEIARLMVEGYFDEANDDR